MIPLYFPPINKLGNAAFRKLCLSCGADFVFSEMVKVERLLDGDETQIRKATLDCNLINKTFIQIISESIDIIEDGVKKVLEINPNLLEINYNMGCPQSSLCKQELGGGIVRNPQKVYDVSKRLFDVCLKYGVRPSVKIRLGIDRDDINIVENVRRIGEAGICKIYIHGRTLRDGYNRPATYDEIGKVIDNTRNQKISGQSEASSDSFDEIEIIGNGDVCDLNSFNKILKTNCSGVLIGRAALENPLIFNDIKNGVDCSSLSGVDMRSRKSLIVEYLGYAQEYDLNLSYIKSNLAYLTKGVVGGADFRRQINDITNLDEIVSFVNMI